MLEPIVVATIASEHGVMYAALIPSGNALDSPYIWICVGLLRNPGQSLHAWAHPWLVATRMLHVESRILIAPERDSPTAPNYCCSQW